MATADLSKKERALWWREQRHSYIEKGKFLFNDCASDICWVDPFDFYRRIFPEGFLEEKGQMVNWGEDGGGKPNALALLFTDKTTLVTTPTGKEYDKRLVERYTITDDFDLLFDLIEKSKNTLYPLYMAPVSYFGKARKSENARFLHAFTVDLDGVGIKQLQKLDSQVMGGVRPKPTEIVLSGKGVHLYYRLKDPVPLVPRNVPALQAIKRHLIDLMWNTETSNIPSEPSNNKRQYQGIYQPFRVVGSATRLSGTNPNHKRKRGKEEYTCMAFEYYKQKPYTVEELIEWIPNYSRKNQKSERQKVEELWDSGGRTPISIARKQWPKWYESRIVNGEGYKTHACAHGNYDTWLERIHEGATVGHRYNCIKTLAAYARKCDIEYEELEEDALALYPTFAAMPSRPGKDDAPFTLDELNKALRTYYDQNSIYFTNGYMSRQAGIEIQSNNRRNGRSQEQHLKRARAVQAIDYPNNSWAGRPKGSKNKNNPKRDLILNYKKEHPEANHSEIARALGISRPTVIKWLKEEN